MKKRTVQRLQLTVVLTLFFVLCYAAFCDNAQQQLAEDVLRLRVVAASDSIEDQAIKRTVRDRMLEELQPLRQQSDSQQQMCKLVQEHLPELVNAAQETVYDCGKVQRVSATLQREWYPTREYDGFALPAGEYFGLQIKIGAAEGQNWWCVLYPSLCLDAAEEQYLTDEEAALIHRSGTEYEIRFRTAELLGSLRGWVERERKE